MVNKGVIGGRVSSKEMYQLVLREACNPCRKRFLAHHYMRKQKYDSDSHRHRIGITSRNLGWLKQGHFWKNQGKAHIQVAKISDRLARLQPHRHTPTQSQNGGLCPVIPYFHSKTDTTQLSGTGGSDGGDPTHKGVIVRSPAATPWLNPAFFIAQNTQSNLRFIMDLSYLNRFLVHSSLCIRPQKLQYLRYSQSVIPL